MTSSNFAEVATTLDRQRLGKQRIETLQILRALTWEKYGWAHHPVTLMWKGHEEALVAYGLVICGEWARRGYADTVAEKLLSEAESAELANVRSESDLLEAGDMPWWVGDTRVHHAHRANLLRKDPTWYRQFWPEENESTPMFWPVRNSNV